MSNNAAEKRWDLYQVPPSFVLGFHGCKASVGEAVLRGEISHLEHSTNEYDWLGTGVYFWEGSPQRAWEWALERQRYWPDGENPFVIGAIINLGRCLDLRDSASLREVKSSYESLRLATEKGKETLPKNLGKEQKLRKLDCAVINFLHILRTTKGLPDYNTVRADFWEGETLYPNAGFREQDHIQICVRDTSSILGYFRPVEDASS